MGQLIKDIIGFTKNLNLVDILLYLAILVLVILVVCLLYIIKTSDYEEEKEEDLDLKEVVTNIENTQSIPTIPFTSYEKDQEEKAIISYEELLAKNRVGSLNYQEEILEDDISIKKINLDNIIEENQKRNEEKKESKLFRYTNEEDFLKALQTLNELLN